MTGSLDGTQQRSNIVGDSEVSAVAKGKKTRELLLGVGTLVSTGGGVEYPARSQVLESSETDRKGTVATTQSERGDCLALLLSPNKSSSTRKCKRGNDQCWPRPRARLS